MNRFLFGESLYPRRETLDMHQKEINIRNKVKELEKKINKKFLILSKKQNKNIVYAKR